VIAIDNVYNAINQISQTTVRNVVRPLQSRSTVVGPASINDQIKTSCDLSPPLPPTVGSQVSFEIKAITLRTTCSGRWPSRPRPTRSPRQDRRPEGEYSGVTLGQAADIITQHPVAPAAAHPSAMAEIAVEKNSPHLPGAIHDDGAGGYRAIVRRISASITGAWNLSSAPLPRFRRRPRTESHRPRSAARRAGPRLRCAQGEPLPPAAFRPGLT